MANKFKEKQILAEYMADAYDSYTHALPSEDEVTLPMLARMA